MDKETIQEYIDENWDSLQEDWLEMLGLTAEQIDEGSHFEEDKFYTWAENEAINAYASKIDEAKERN